MNGYLSTDFRSRWRTGATDKPRDYLRSAAGIPDYCLERNLRAAAQPCKSSHHTQKKENHARITDALSIRERPAGAKDRGVPGHWEGDLLCRSRNSQIATLVERHTRSVMRVKLDGKDSETVISALIENARNLPQEL